MLQPQTFCKLAVVAFLAAPASLEAQGKGTGDRAIATPILPDTSIIPASRPPVKPKRFVAPTRTLNGQDTLRAPSKNGTAAREESALVGFRIHLLTSTLIGQARSAEQVAAELFDQPVRLDYEVPYYKVRVGEFSLRAEAEAYLATVKKMGYDEAWVVPFTRMRPSEQPVDSVTPQEEPDTDRTGTPGARP